MECSHYDHLNASPKEIIEVAKATYGTPDNFFENERVIHIHGARGVGKTHIANAIGKECGFEKVILINLSQTTPLDIAVPDIGKAGSDLDFKIDRNFLKEGDEKILIFFDEFSCVSPHDGRAAWLSVILGKTFKGQHFGKNIRFLTAGNRPGIDGADAHEYPIPFNDRVIHLNFRPVAKEWASYAETVENVNRDVTSFVLSNPDLLNAVDETDPTSGTSPRSWSEWGKQYSQMIENGTSQQIMNIISCGRIGKKASLMFWSYVQEINSVVNWDKLLSGTLEPIEILKGRFSPHGSKHSVSYLGLQMSIMNGSMSRIKNPEEFDNVFNYIDSWESKAFSSLFLHDAQNNDGLFGDCYSNSSQGVSESQKAWSGDW